MKLFYREIEYDFNGQIERNIIEILATLLSDEIFKSV